MEHWYLRGGRCVLPCVHPLTLLTSKANIQQTISPHSSYCCTFWTFGYLLEVLQVWPVSSGFNVGTHQNSHFREKGLWIFRGQRFWTYVGPVKTSHWAACHMENHASETYIMIICIWRTMSLDLQLFKNDHKHSKTWCGHPPDVLEPFLFKNP